MLQFDEKSISNLYIFRPDMRGSGDSTGFYYDEYDYQEQKDACELIGNVMWFICKYLTSIAWASTPSAHEYKSKITLKVDVLII